MDLIDKLWKKHFSGKYYTKQKVKDFAIDYHKIMLDNQPSNLDMANEYAIEKLGRPDKSWSNEQAHEFVRFRDSVFMSFGLADAFENN